MVKQYIIIEGDTPAENEAMPIDTPEQVAEARSAIAEAGIDKVPVWFGDPNDPDSYKSDTLSLNAAEVG